ncbi:MAG TPA: BBP7 family outer membrane beta-barrel protein [Gemmataceae bacterium]|nr:BBP7 family outer membrane beta-barrel protein [Gemmataceae bacterium]
MRKELVASMFALFAGAGGALAQCPAPSACSPGDACAAACGWPCPEAECKPKAWVSGEYLLWRIKDGPLPYPLGLTGSPATPNPGALNAGGVPFLTGPHTDYGTLSGMRVSAGTWLDSDAHVGIEGSGFLLPKQTKTYRAASDPNGSPVIAFRYLDPPVGGAPAVEDSFQASLPAGNGAGAGPFAGGVGVVSSTRLWGAEVNGVLGLVDRSKFRLQALAGARYADLQESLNLQFQSTAIDGGMVPFQGNTFPAPSAVSTLDSFQTHNQFYGGQLGLRGEYNLGKFFVSGTGKVALGSNHEVVNVAGTSSLFTPGNAPLTVPGGQFAGPSNIGRTTHDDFAVLPEVEVKAGIQATRWLRAYVGYDFLYWSRVVRPGNQVDLIVNDAGNAVNPGFVRGATSGLGFPRPQFNKTDFWAQGLTFGLEIRY